MKKDRVKLKRTKCADQTFQNMEIQICGRVRRTPNPSFISLFPEIINHQISELISLLSEFLLRNGDQKRSESNSCLFLNVNIYKRYDFEGFRLPEESVQLIYFIVFFQIANLVKITIFFNKNSLGQFSSQFRTGSNGIIFSVIIMA